MSKLRQLHSEEEFEQVITDSNYKATIVDFTAAWCQPCQTIGPIFEEFSKSFSQINFIKVDVDELEDLARSQGVGAMPSFFVYQQGVKVETMVGAIKDDLYKLIKKYNG